MRPDQQRVQTLLTDTVTLLCKNGLQYNKELKVQGLLGITLDDDDVFIVHINKIFDDIRGRKPADPALEKVKVTNIPPSGGEDDFENTFFDSKVDGIHISNIPPSHDMFENVDGKEYYQKPETSPPAAASTAVTGMQLPVIHSLQTGIMSRSVAKKKTTSKGIKRPIGAAKRKEKRSVKARLDSSFTASPSFSEIQVKDEPPDQLDNGDTNNERMTNGEHYDSLVTYETYEDCDSPATTNSKDNHGGDAMDMIECLLYNESVDQSESGGGGATGGIYKKVHISGAEDSPLALEASVDDEDVLAGCSGWDDKPDTSLTTSHKVSRSSNKSTSSPSVQDDTVTYHGVSRQDVNDALASQYRDLLEAAAIQGDGYPCVECDQILKTRAIWMEHMKGVHMNRKYACPHCGETFKWRSSRKRHMLISHNDKSATSAAEVLDTNVISKLYRDTGGAKTEADDTSVSMATTEGGDDDEADMGGDEDPGALVIADT